MPARPEFGVLEGRDVEDVHHFEQVMTKGFPAPELEGLSAESVLQSLRHSRQSEELALTTSPVEDGCVRFLFITLVERSAVELEQE